MHILRLRRIHDIDDNLLITPTKIHLVDLHGNPMSVSTGVFAEIRQKAGIIFDYLEDGGSFKEFDPGYQKRFAADSLISEPGPVMHQFAQDVNDGIHFGIATSRAYYPIYVRIAIEKWIIESRFGIELSKFIDGFLEFVRREEKLTAFPRHKLRDIIKKDEIHIVRKYLERCPIFTVNNPAVRQWLNKRYGTNYTDTASLKSLAVRAFVELMYPEFWRITNRNVMGLGFDFTDDDLGFIKMVHRAFTQMKMEGLGIFQTSFTGDSGSIIKRAA